mmetsp:Transcript_7383/g.27002  ORF Transcript_7383/g.27002 Transcript_7383/m.27002 type:complete len:269 (-) Transcript_7383:256-1062(-)
MYNGGANKLPSERKCVNNNCRPPPRPPKVPETQCRQSAGACCLEKRIQDWAVPLPSRNVHWSGPLRVDIGGPRPSAEQQCATFLPTEVCRPHQGRPAAETAALVDVRMSLNQQGSHFGGHEGTSHHEHRAPGIGPHIRRHARIQVCCDSPALARTSGDMPASRYAATASRQSLCTKLSNDNASSSSRKYPRARRRGIAGRSACSTAKSNGLAAGPLDPKSGDLPAEVSKKSSSRMASHPTEGRPFSRAQRLSSSNADSSHAVALFGGE